MEGKLTIDDGTTEKQRPAKIMTNKLEYIKKHILPSLFKNPNSAPFVVPVNHKLLNIPDYPIVIKSAIDLSKIKNRLRSKYYYDSKECLSDFNLMFLNCYVYNLPGSEVVMLGLKLNEVFKEKVKLMPDDEYEVNFPKKRGEGGKRGRNSGNMKSDLSSIGSGPNSVASGKNIKITAESCYDMSPTPSPKNRSREENEVKRPRLTEELRLCGNVLKEIISIRYRHLNELFLEPVLKKFPSLSDYSQIIKNPMDLGTIRTKLEDYQYKTKDDFMSDINLMFDNCYAYNGAESSVSQLARDLRRKFDETYAKVFGLNKATPAASLNSTISNAHHHVTPVVNNISSIPQIHPVTKPEPVSLNITQDPKSVLENYQKDLKHVVNALIMLDNNLKKFAETQGLTYESAMHMVPQINGTSKRNAIMPSSSHHSKKRKVHSTDSLTAMFGGSCNSKRGRKTHKLQQPQKLLPISSAQPVTSTPNLMFATATNPPLVPIVSSVSNSYTASLLSTQQSAPSTQQAPVVEPPLQVQTNHTVEPQAQQVLPPQQPPPPPQTQPQPQPPAQPNSVFDNLDMTAYTSWNARRNLSMMIEKLSGKQLGRVIEIIKENEAAYSDWNLDELDIDFELLLPQTLKELYKFVYSTCHDQIPPLSTPQLDNNGINNGVGGHVIGGFGAQQPPTHTTQNNMMIQQSHPHVNNSTIPTVPMPNDQQQLSLNNTLPNNLNPLTTQSIITQQQQQHQQQQSSQFSNKSNNNNNESHEDGQVSDSSSNSSDSSTSKSDDDDDDDDESSESDSESET